MEKASAQSLCLTNIMSSRKQKLLRHLGKQQSKVQELTSELSALNLGISDTLVKLEREEARNNTERRRTGFTLGRRQRDLFCVGDIVQVTNSYKGTQGNLKGKTGTVLAVGSSFITIDIPSVTGTTFRAPHNLKLVTPSPTIEIQETADS